MFTLSVSKDVTQGCNSIYFKTYVTHVIKAFCLLLVGNGNNFMHFKKGRAQFGPKRSYNILRINDCFASIFFLNIRNFNCFPYLSEALDLYVCM